MSFEAVLLCFLSRKEVPWVLACDRDGGGGAF